MEGMMWFYVGRRLGGEVACRVQRHEQHFLLCIACDAKSMIVK